MLEKKEFGKIIFLDFSKIGECGRTKTPCFPQYDFLCGRIRTIFSDFPRISEHLEIAEKERTNLVDLLFFSSVSIFQTEM